MADNFQQDSPSFQGGIEFQGNGGSQGYSVGQATPSGAMKRSADDSGMENDGLAPLKRFCRGEGPHIELRVLLQSKNAGAIIGKQGSNIKKLRAGYNATITVPDSSGPERILSINSELGTVCECLRDIIPSFEDYQGYNVNDDFECEIRLLVHQSQAGCIIGRSGSKIKELRESTGTNIKVYTECCPGSTERVTQLHGPISKVILAVGVVYDLLQTAPPKGPSNNYIPDLQDHDFIDPATYGGYTKQQGRGDRGFGGSGGSGFRGGRGGHQRGGMRGGRGGFDRSAPRGRGNFGGGRGGYDGSYNHSGMRGNYGNERGRSYSGGNNDHYQGGSNSNYSGPADQQGFDSGPSSGGNITKTQVSIPKDLAGAIIGKGGSRIKQIRQQSMAQIQIDEAVQGSNDRIITITGSQEQIQNAQYLLQLSVKQHQGSSGGGGGSHGPSNQY